MSNFKVLNLVTVSSSEQIEQLVSKSSPSEELDLIVCPDFNRCFRNFAGNSTIVEFSKILLAGVRDVLTKLVAGNGEIRAPV
ncbi:MAG TPA: hypothetical protein VNE86_00295 [Nitrososphaerales archaeon]|nr:hypothetical protein [Nitrososphaerales archaeon]